MNKNKILFYILIFFINLKLFSQTDTTKPNPCEIKSDCAGCPCLLKTDSKYLPGLDIAYQGIEGGLQNIKWDSVLANSSLKFIFIKKSTGCDTSTKKVKYWHTFYTRVKVMYDNDWFFYQNRDFLRDYRNTTGRKFYLGVYHYFYNNTSADMQAETFLRNLKLENLNLLPRLSL